MSLMIISALLMAKNIWHPPIQTIPILKDWNSLDYFTSSMTDENDGP